MVNNELSENERAASLLRRSLGLAAVGVLSLVFCGPSTARGEFLSFAWRGEAGTAHYAWANPFASPTSLGGSPELYSYAPNSQLLPSDPPTGTAAVVTAAFPGSSGNFYTFAAEPFTLRSPSSLSAGDAGTIALQVRGFLGEAGGFLDGIGLGSSKRAPDSTTLRSSQTVSPPGAPGPQTLVEYLYLWENVGDQSGSFEISFTKAAHGSLSGFAIDSSIAAEAVPEPTTAALAAAGALAVAGSAARRLLRRRRRHAVAGASPSSSCSSSSPSSACSSGSCCRRSGRSGRPPAARSA